MHTHSGEAEPPTEQNDPPFALSYVFKANVKQKYTCVATFPWDAGSIDELWKGQLTPPPETTPTTDVSTRWSSICEKYGGSFAIGSDAGDLEIWKVNLAADSRTRNAVDRLLAVSLKEYGEVTAVAWVLSPDYVRAPFVVAAARRTVFVIDAENGSLISRFQGHGSAITAIAVHPVYPHMLCTTSRDFTARIYDLKLSPRTRVKARPWPGTPAPNHGAPPHGSQAAGEEEGLGSCVTILMGGRSGGHEAAVLNAAFHPVDPIIATCGLDRRIKIWPLAHLVQMGDDSTIAQDNSESPAQVVDKPLFSSAKIHAARVLSVTWLQRSHLVISHSAPAIMREELPPSQDSAFLSQDNATQPQVKDAPANAETVSQGQSDLDDTGPTYRYYEEPGTICLWQWLGGARFFPALEDPTTRGMTSFRGCASDYQASSSFQVISKVSLPSNALTMDVHYSGAETPFVLIPLPGKRTVRMLYLDDLPTDIGAGPFPVQKDKVDAEEWENYERALAYHRSGPSLEQLPGYNLNIDTVEDEPINVEYIKACAVSCDGGLLVAVGKCGVQILLR